MRQLQYFPFPPLLLLLSVLTTPTAHSSGAQRRHWDRDFSAPNLASRTRTQPQILLHEEGVLRRDVRRLHMNFIDDVNSAGSLQFARQQNPEKSEGKRSPFVQRLETMALWRRGATALMNQSLAVDHAGYKRPRSLGSGESLLFNHPQMDKHRTITVTLSNLPVYTIDHA